ncbi:hypothetical protein [Bacillus wiedmannii]|uniref:hypothetical protein n=1 Tax=Bacillus wiedmannii TaxID=1890302 RepID=UPI00065BB1E0|nr:hypothetical protein [Bacillus wiedmannii]KMP28798.1 hypothetical protein TU50_06170 [Bacillus wiedmannii]
MIQGKLINNNSQKLTIIFQSAGRIPDHILDKILLKQTSREEVALYHQKYNWIKIATNKETDYLFLEDFFSDSYGWYMIDSGKDIIEEFNHQLSEFIEQHHYKEVITFGSSKGGTGALLYGLLNPKITTVFSVVPQINSIKYINKYMNKYKSLFFPKPDTSLEKQLDEIFYNPELYKNDTHKNTTIYFYTGLGDDQFNEILKFQNFIVEKVKSSTIIINSSQKKHTPLVVDNVAFIEDLLHALENNNKISNKNLVKLQKGLFLLKDK